MRCGKYSPPDCRGLFLQTVVAFACILMPALAQAETRNFPVMFDKTERIGRPDLSDMPRLRFLTSTDFPPFNFADQTGRLSGFHVDLIRAICAELNMTSKCQIQALPYEDLEKALASGEGDAVIAGIAPTAKLRSDFAFTRPYMTLPARFAVRDASGLKDQDVASLFGKKVGVTAGTRHEAMLKAFFPTVKATPFESRAAGDEALRDARIDAIFGDGLQLSFWTHSKAANNCCTLFAGPYFSPAYLGEGLTIMVNKDNNDLTVALESALANVSRDGRLEDIYDRYFPYDLYGEMDAGTRAQSSAEPVSGQGTALQSRTDQPVELKPVTQ